MSTTEKTSPVTSTASCKEFWYVEIIPNSFLVIKNNTVYVVDKVVNRKKGISNRHVGISDIEKQYCY